MLANNNKPTRLREIFPGADYFPAGADPALTNVRSDVTEVIPGDVFVQLDEFDPIDAEEAEYRGASVIVAERLLPGIQVTQVVVDDCFEACRMLAALEAEEAAPPAATRIHIAGARGAERAANLLAALHATAGENVGLLTESCEDDGEICLSRRRNSRRGADWWSHRCRLGGVSTEIIATTPRLMAHEQPLVACLTSLRCDTLDERGNQRWQSSESHRNAVLRSLGGIDSAVTLVTNADDAECQEFADEHTGRVITFGEGDQADIRGMMVENTPGGQELIVTAGGESIGVALPTPGRGARRDLLAAIATAVAVGFDLSKAAADSGVRPALPLSLEPVSCGQPFTVMLDRAVGSLDLADAIEGAAAGTGRTYITLRLADEARIAERQIAVASHMADRVIAHGDAGLLSDIPSGVTIVEDRLAAMAVVIGLADEGDTVLLAGCFDDEKDRETATNLLRRRLACEDQRAAA